MNLDWITLSFPGQLEKDFLQDYYEKSVKHVQLALLIAIFFYGLFGVLDAWLVPEVKHRLWFIRYCIFTPLSLLIYLFSFSAQFKNTCSCPAPR
jgi:hypothetical protein